MDLLQFSEDEIMAELSRLGYNSVPTDKLKWFKQELENLVSSDLSVGSENCSVELPEFGEDSICESKLPSQRGLCHNNQRNTSQILKDATSVNRHRDNIQYQNTSDGVDNLSRKQEQYSKLSNPNRLLPRPELVELTPVSGSDPLPILSADYNSRSISHGNWQSLRKIQEAECLDTSVVSISSGQEDTSVVSECDSEGRRQVRRKTLRKTDAGSLVIDESISRESEPGSLACLQERLAELGVYNDDNDDDVTDNVNNKNKHKHAINSTSSIGSRPRRPWTSQDDDPYRLRPDFSSQPPSVILRATDHTGVTNRLRKSDPVKRYEQYRQTWTAQRTAGVREEKHLRWAVREHMLRHDDVTAGKKQHKVYVANSYVAPTDKKRQALRWRVRMDMAQGHIPT